MAREVVVAGDLPYTVNFDDPRRRGDLFQSLVLAQLFDELTGNPVSGPVTVTTNLAGARRAYRPQRCRGPRRQSGTRLPAPRRPAVSLRRPLRRRRLPPARASAGDRRAATDLPRHRSPTRTSASSGSARQPVSFTVRALEPDLPNPPRPVANATIEISRVWRLVADLGNAPIAADIVALRALALRGPAATGDDTRVGRAQSGRRTRPPAHEWRARRFPHARRQQCRHARGERCRRDRSRRSRPGRAHRRRQHRRAERPELAGNARPRASDRSSRIARTRSCAPSRRCHSDRPE